jgi:hypothetical protein
MDSIFWIIIVNLVLYFRTLRYKFVSDDLAVFMQPPEFKNRWHKYWLRFIGALKIKNKSFYFMKIRGKFKCVITETEEIEHLLALLLHTAICVMIYLAFGSSPISFVAALLYATNPVNNQGTIWPGGRGYALPILCILLALTWDWASPALIFSGWFTIGFLAPLCLLGSIKWYLVGVWVLGCIINARKFIKAVKSKAGVESFVEDRLSFHPRKFVLAIKTFGFYFTLCIIPFRITFYHNFLQSAAGSLKHKAYTIWDKYFWIGLATLTAMIVLWVFHPWTILSWACLAWCITVAPFCNFVRANQEIAERFVALPNVFLMFALAQVIVISPVIITAFLIFYITRTYYTLQTYKDEYFITEMAIMEDPHAWWAWHCRAMKRWNTQSYKEALILWVMAKMISPKEFKLLINISTCLRLLKNQAEADKYLKEAEDNMVAGQEKEAKEFIFQCRTGKPIILL